MQAVKWFITLTIFFLAGLPTLASAALGDYFAQTSWLAENRSNVVILDARQTPLFLIGHIEHLSCPPFICRKWGWYQSNSYPIKSFLS